MPPCWFIPRIRICWKEYWFLLYSMRIQDDVFRHSWFFPGDRHEYADDTLWLQSQWNSQSSADMTALVGDTVRVQARCLFKPRLSFVGLEKLEILLVERPAHLILCLNCILLMRLLIPTQGRREVESSSSRSLQGSYGIQRFPSSMKTAMFAKRPLLLPKSEMDGTMNILPSVWETFSLQLDGSWLFSDVISAEVDIYLPLIC
jgi:hypothetical protein